MHQTENQLNQDSFKIRKAYEIVSQDIAVACVI